MTPFDKVFPISIDALIDRIQIDEIRAKGYSRIPIYYGHPSFIIGILLVKTLIGADIEKPVTLRELCKIDTC